MLTYFELCYNALVQTSFYASGFLYSLKTQQILLFKPSDLISTWSIMGGENKKGEEAVVTFQRIVMELLNLNLEMKHIYPVYDYFSDIFKKTNFVFYGEVRKIPDLICLKKDTFSWLAFNETLKLLFSQNSKQDVTVGQRVINLKQRLSQNLQ